MEVNYLDLVREGYMGSMQWQLGREMGTIPAFTWVEVAGRRTFQILASSQPSGI